MRVEGLILVVILRNLSVKLVSAMIAGVSATTAGISFYR